MEAVDLAKGCGMVALLGVIGLATAILPLGCLVLLPLIAEWPALVIGWWIATILYFRYVFPRAFGSRRASQPQDHSAVLSVRSVADATGVAEAAYMQRIERLEQIKFLDPVAFELFVGSLFQQLGYVPQMTPISGDEGVDLILKRGIETAVVQCKRYEGTVGQPAVRDLYGTMVHNRAQKAYLVTTGTFSLPAQQWVKGKPVHLVDGRELVEWIQTMAEAEPAASDELVGLVTETAVQDVAAALQRILQEGTPGGRNFAIFTVPDPSKPYYVQFSASREGTELLGEAVNVEFFGPEFSMTQSQTAQLLSLGWKPPVYESELYPGNYHRRWTVDDYDDVRAVARLAVRTLLEVYEMPPSTSLHVQVHVE